MPVLILLGIIVGSGLLAIGMLTGSNWLIVPGFVILPASVVAGLRGSDTTDHKAA